MRSSTLARSQNMGLKFMAAYLIRRLWQMVPTLFGVVLLVFFLFKWFGGDPAEILGGLNATPEQIAAIRQQLGLDQSVWTQLGLYFKSIATFDWGKSWATNEAVSNLFMTRLPATLTVMLPILILDVLLALPIAMWVAYRRGSLTDRTLMVVTTVALAISFLVYVIVGQYVFGFLLGWFPVQGWSDSVWTNLTTYAPLPVLLAVMVGLAPQTRLYRTFFLDELGHDYVRTARAKGLTENTVMFKHVLRNAMIPILTNIGLQLPTVFVGSFLIEVFFSIPGLGREVLLAVNRSDYPVIQAVTVYLAVITMSINLLVDLLFKVVDPRVVLK
jgi:peptide/nickel transport system permease protein